MRTSSVRSMASVRDGVRSALDALASAGVAVSTITGAAARTAFALATVTAPENIHVPSPRLQLRARHPLFCFCQPHPGQPLLQPVDTIGAPEQLAVEDAGRYAEQALAVGIAH